MHTGPFSRREVERSFRKFSDLADDLLRATHQTWPEFLVLLVDHCRNDAVMSLVTRPLRANPRIDIDCWLNDFRSSKGGFVGSARYSLPKNHDDRISVIYQLLERIADEKVPVFQFCMDAYGSLNFNDMICDFNDQLLRIFVRDVGYRLEDVLKGTRGQDQIAPESIHLFPSINIYGDVQGSTIAVAGRDVTLTTAAVGEDLRARVRTLADVIDQLSLSAETQAQAAEDVKLLESATTESASRGDVASAVERLSKLGESVTSKLKEIATSAAARAVESAVVGAIKYVLGRRCF